MVFSVNQVRQLYVVDGNATCVKGADGSFYYKVKDAQGKIRATLSINPEDVDWIHYAHAEALAIKLKKIVVTLNDEAFPGGKTISGEDYLLRINFRLFYGMSDEDIYQKYGVVHGTSSMTKAQFIEAMIKSLKKNMGREQVDVLDFNATSDGFEILEKSQVSEWALGTKKLERVFFDVVPTTVTEPDTYNEIIWAEVSKLQDLTGDAATISNAYTIADMEYFYHGYRGDQYRSKGWPDVIPTKYMVEMNDTNIKNGFDVVDIQYHYAGDNEDSLKSAKTITLVAPKGTEVLKTLAQNAAYCAGKKVKEITENATIVIDGVDPSSSSEE